jgi:hypothetical protein
LPTCTRSQFRSSAKESGYDIDNDTRNEQHRFFAEALRPAKMRTHVCPTVREVEACFFFLVSPS